MGTQLTIEHAIERAMKRTDPNAHDALERDAAAVARVLIKHWGDDAPRVLERAGELVRDQISGWAGDGPRGSVGAGDLTESGSMDPEGARET